MWCRSRPRHDRELPSLGDQLVGRAPDLHVDLEESTRDEPGGGCTSHPTRRRTSADMGGQFDRRCPVDGEVGVEDRGWHCVDEAQEADRVDRLVIGKAEPSRAFRSGHSANLPRTLRRRDGGGCRPALKTEAGNSSVASIRTHASGGGSDGGSPSINRTSAWGPTSPNVPRTVRTGRPAVARVARAVENRGLASAPRWRCRPSPNVPVRGNDR